jgi:hypothetical protein
MVYDAAKDRLAADYAVTPLASVLPFDKSFPAPPTLEAWRARKAAQEQQRQAKDEVRKADGSELKR